MLKKGSNYKELAESICSEVQSCLPTQFERSAAKKVLLGKIEKLLLASDINDAAPESRSVTILLSDIRGFTALAETFSALTVMELLNRYFSRMTEVIVQHGGTIDKLMGDSIMVLFGAPQSGVDDVERAIACAVEMQRAMSEFNEQNLALGLPEMFMGIGINTGQVMAGSLGSDHHREYTVIGDEVNLTSRIEAQSLRGQILISENTYRMAKSFVLVGEPNKVRVKGKKEAVHLYDLMGTTRPRAMTVPRREIRKSPRVAIHMPCFFHRLVGKQVDSKEFQGEVVDLGYNGLLMVSPIMLEPFSEIKMQVSLQLLGTGTTDIYARVVKVDQGENGVLCSLEFTSMDTAGQQTIKQFVDNQLYQS
ncbi:adenylate/guanylate cyclase domain-containing protein [Oceanicoccus sagamiensis]|uniref:Adenylate cyclase n=1 Tax=Oceanicoccus sagamiensis TaxID=716816 RepID=A0A1X9NDX0_9GAMM|nr:adenylate/guanylate cyclase domain-containing protein [Oceanicoccus sagamiensis]ARN73739.1 adenylate cyclase [Oceanicoccus sagamiensis]